MSLPGEREPNDDAGQAAKAAAILGAVLALIALSLYGTRTAFSVLVGATIGVANLLTMRAIIRRLVRVSSQDGEPQGGNPKGDASSLPDDRAGEHEPGGRGGIAWGVFAAFKMLILFGGIWFLLTRHVVDPMPLLVGYGVMPLGIAASAVWSSLRERN
ncbi:MAG TPA: hypothetical protein VM925_05115 [Labilithrix sp.]|nr:hypothetical protein [Labilithrix sp.]